MVSKDRKRDSVLSRLNLNILISAAIAILCAIGYDALIWDTRTLQVLTTDELPLSIFVLQIVSSSLSFLALFFIFYYYYTLSQQIKDQWKYANVFSAFLGSEAKWQFLVEFSLFLLTPFPTDLGVTFNWGLSHRVPYGIMVFRFYLMLRFLRDRSTLYQERHHFYEECGGDFQATAGIGSKSIFKVFFQEQSGKVLCIFFVMVWVLGSWAIWLVERSLWLPTDSNSFAANYKRAHEFHPDDFDQENFFDQWEQNVFVDFGMCLYHSAVTMTSLGYGVYVTKSPEGNVIAGTIAIMGIINISLIMSIIINATTSTQYDHKLQHWLTEREHSRKLVEIGSRIIQLTWRLRVTKRMITDPDYIPEFKGIENAIQYKRSLVPNLEFSTRSKDDTEQARLLMQTSRTYKRQLSILRKKFRYHESIIGNSFENVFGTGMTGLGNSGSLDSINLEGVYCHQSQKFIRSYYKHHFNHKRKNELEDREKFMTVLHACAKTMKGIDPAYLMRRETLKSRVAL